MYMFVTLFTGCVVALHNVMVPHFPSYVTSLVEDSPIYVLIISSAVEFYMISLCILHTGTFEILMMATVRSVRHCIESLSNLNSVSMERRVN